MMPTNCPWGKTVDPVVLLTLAEFCVKKITTQNNWRATLNGVMQNFKWTTSIPSLDLAKCSLHLFFSMYLSAPNLSLPTCNKKWRRDHFKVPGKIKISRDLRGGRWSWTFKLDQKRSWVGRWSWAVKVGLLSLRVVRQQQCYGHCLCDCPAR